jgi:Glycosyl hydrolase family 26
VSLVSVVAVLAVTAGCRDSAVPSLGLPSDPSAPVERDPSPSLTPGAAIAYKTTGRGPDVPATHAWFGAYVDSVNQTAAARRTAVDAFETTVGRPLAIVHTFHPWGSRFPDAFDFDIQDDGQIDLVSWAGTDSAGIGSGLYDDAIRKFATGIRDFRSPVLLRYRWEMDRKNLTATVGRPAAFVAAWLHVRRIFTEVGATNAAWVWCPTADAFADGSAAAYYPGDANVDWIGADVYPSTTDLSFAALMAPVLRFGQAHRRPIIVGEFGVQEAATPNRAGWFASVDAVLATQPQIKAMVYFSKATTTKPVYDTTIGSPPATLSAFRAMVAGTPLSAAVDR